MSLDPETIYRLLPSHVRVRDAEQGEPLRALLAIVAEQVAVLQDDLEQLYDDQFIETCAEWVVPYIGELVGAQALRRFKGARFSQRALVADAIAARRSKGTVSALQRLAADTTQWGASVVEYFERLATTQHVKHVRPTNVTMPDLRRGEALEDVGTPFDPTARTFEARRVATRRGRYNIPNIGLFLWRLDAHRLSLVPPHRLGGHRFLLDPLGREGPLYARREDDARRLARPISRRALDADLVRCAANPEACTGFYGAGRSLEIQVDGVPVAASQVRCCDLSDVEGGDWAQAPGDRYVVDPVRGRLLAPAGLAESARLRVTFHYGFPTQADIGGGEYARDRTFMVKEPPVFVSAPQTIQAALNALAGKGAVEIVDNETYAESLAVHAAAGQEVELRARDGGRPIVRSAGLTLTADEGGKVTLDGLVLDGGAVRVPAAGNRLETLRLRHCTIAPGAGPALEIDLPDCTVEIESCILGAIRAVGDAVVRVSNSIVDAGAEDTEAFAGLVAEETGAVLRVRNSTLIGRVRTRILESASNTIFLAVDPFGAPVRAERLQEGGVRFSYVPPGSHVPRRYNCQPAGDAVDDHVRPVLASRRPGDPGYGQLHVRCPAAIRQGADDGAEMGAFHDLFQPQRVGNLAARLEEHLRFGLEAGIFFAS